MLTFVSLEDNDFQTPLLAYKDRLWEIFETSTTASNEYNGLRLAGIKGLKLMAIIRHYLSENEV
jgi:DNA repair/transcription protein MET18/MMS19